MRAEDFFRSLQRRLCSELVQLDGGGDFRVDSWERPGGGGGTTAVLQEGGLFEKAGVNTSSVWGEFDDGMLQRMGGSERSFFATGISTVLHPRSPLVPTLHANFRHLQRGDDAWFGGGSDLTPYYPYRDDVVHFHRVWKTVCDRHDIQYYPRFKRWCDEYFFIPHRGETRGVGGIFFDDLRGDLEAIFAFVKDCGDALLDAYRPIVQRRRDEPYSDRERRFQLYRRGRYVEFNLVYDRGTSFGLGTHGRAESILVSLPPLVRWDYGYVAEPGSREAEALTFLSPQEWL